MNERILSAPVIFLTGAGASAHLGPLTTTKFIAYLESQLAKDASTLERLRQACSPHQNMTDLDIEVLLDHATRCEEAYSLLRQDPSLKGSLDANDPQVTNVREKIAAYSRFKEKAYNTVINHYSKMDAARAKDFYKAIFLNLSQSLGIKTIPIFILNY